MDYFNQKRFEKVNEGDLLARYHEPTKGEFGFDVCGKLLVPKQGKPKPRLHGKGFKTSDDGKETYAAISGKIEYCNYDLSVVNVYEVNGNLDMSIRGILTLTGMLILQAGVRSGVTVHAMGSIYMLEASLREQHLLARERYCIKGWC
ncbi:MAG: flagellar assembly protein A [Lachnospira eligens]